MNTENRGAQKYFDKVPNQWDAIYSHEDWLRFQVNRLLRPGIFRRYELAFSECGDLNGKTVLDVGCGTGRFAIECAKRGAKRVVGIDFSAQMIDFCQQMAREVGVADRTEFICSDFVRYPFEESFDAVLALGLFDYVKEADPLFKKIVSLGPEVFVASFPRFDPIWSTQRYLRYYLVRNCPVYDYSETILDQLYQNAPFESHRLESFRTGFLGVGYNAQKIK